MTSVCWSPPETATLPGVLGAHALALTSVAPAPNSGVEPLNEMVAVVWSQPVKVVSDRLTWTWSEPSLHWAMPTP